ncbi:hypothetical protein [Streptomyces sp. NPDC090021]|uniref:hypothetical protein n=1 Tax=Streptomyces sp. NPDC090021 TaxID=3365919 RepID=UPI0037FA3609
MPQPAEDGSGTRDGSGRATAPDPGTTDAAASTRTDIARSVFRERMRHALPTTAAVAALGEPAGLLAGPGRAGGKHEDGGPAK